MSMREFCRICIPCVVVLLLGICPKAARAGEEVVDGVLKVFNSSDELDNLTVKNGGRAEIYGSKINGNLTVEGANSLAQVKNASIGKNVIVLDNGWVNLEETEIVGSVVGDGCRQINLWIVDIGANVYLTGCGELAGYFAYVDGSVRIEKGGNFYLHGWDVAGNMSVTENQATGWGQIVAGCNIDGNLAVTGNRVNNLVVNLATVGKNLKVTDNIPKAIVTNTTVGGNQDVE